jgi:hypothetical protein
MKLIYRNTGAPVQVGDNVKTFRDEPVTVTGFTEPARPTASGFVQVTDSRGKSCEFYPSVINAEWAPGEVATVDKQMVRDHISGLLNEADQTQALADALTDLIQAVQYTPLGVRALKAVDRGREALKQAGRL